MTVALILAPFTLAIVVFVFRRLRTVTSWITVAALVVQAVVLLRMGTPPPVEVFGRTLELGPFTRNAMAWVAIASAAVELLAWRLPQASETAPLFLMTVSLVGLAFGVQILAFTAMALQVALLLTVMLVQGEHPGDASGAQRMLSLTLLGMPAFLLAGWLLERSGSPAAQPVEWRAVGLLVALGVTAWSGCAPLQAWAGVAGRTAGPLVSAWVYAAWQPMVFLLLARVLANYPQLDSQGGLLGILGVLGLLTIAASAVLSLGRPHFGSLFGYTSLLGMGVTLLVLGQGTGRSTALAVLLLVGRAASAIIGGAGLASIRQRAGSLGFGAIRGMGRSLPWSTAAALVGGLGLAGLPLGPAFGTYWAAYLMLTDRATWFPLVPIVGSALLGLGWWRGLQRLVDGEGSRAAREPRLVRLFLGVLVVGGLVLAVWPRPMIDIAEAVARAVETVGR